MSGRLVNDTSRLGQTASQLVPASILPFPYQSPLLPPLRHHPPEDLGPIFSNPLRGAPGIGVDNDLLTPKIMYHMVPRTNLTPFPIMRNVIDINCTFLASYLNVDKSKTMINFQLPNQPAHPLHKILMPGQFRTLAMFSECEMEKDG